jgi:hypothetical protein
MENVRKVVTAALVASGNAAARMVASDKWLWYFAGIRLATAACGILTGQPAVAAEIAGCGCG